MILLLFLYDPLYTSSYDLESDYPCSGLKDDNSPTPHLIANPLMFDIHIHIMSLSSDQLSSIFHFHEEYQINLYLN
jgi:hypothetical protein